MKVWVVIWHEQRDGEPLIEIYATEALALEEQASHPTHWNTQIFETEVIGLPPYSYERSIELLHQARNALSSLIRLAYPLSPSWPVEASQAFDEIESFLYPDDAG